MRTATTWQSNAESLAVFSEVCAQLVEATLESNMLEEVRTLRQLMLELEFEAREKLEASQGCEELRMLLTRLDRHVDDVSD